MNLLGATWVCRRRHRREVAILMYHGLVTDKHPSEWTQLPVETFERQMQYIAEHCHPVSLDEAVDYLDGKSELPDNPVVVTFDDGYHSNYSLGHPILTKHKIPATVFVTTSLAGAETGDRRLWFDTIYALQPVTDNGVWDLASYGLPSLAVSSEQDRLTAVETICSRLKEMPPETRLEKVGQLVEAFPPRQTGDDRYYGASWSEISGAVPLIQPGAHTINHEILSQLGTDRAREEIAGSRRIIEAETGAEVRFFAYPNGRREDFTEETRQLVIESGYRGAVSTIEGLNKQGNDLYELKRIGIGSDSSMIWFRLALAGFFDTWRALFGAARR